MLTAMSSQVCAQDKKRNLPQRVNDMLTDYYYNPQYDTAYVLRPKEKWLFRVMVNQAGNYIHAKGTVRDVYSEYDLHTKSNTSISLEVGYCDLAAALSITPSKFTGDYDDYELNLQYHGRRLSIDFNYQLSTSLAGDMELRDISHLGEDALRMNVFNITGYYTFNNRRFSFPAAMIQNFYQHRSAGSWLAGVSFLGGSIKTTDELKARSPQAPEVHLKFANIGIGGGYGYNFVFGRRSQWLFHLSALPTFVVYRHNRLSVNNEQVSGNGMGFNMIFNERASVVYHFSPRYFAGATMLMSNSIFDNDDVVIKQNKWLARAFFGLRL